MGLTLRESQQLGRVMKSPGRRLDSTSAVIVTGLRRLLYHQALSIVALSVCVSFKFSIHISPGDSWMGEFCSSIS